MILSFLFRNRAQNAVEMNSTVTTRTSKSRSMLDSEEQFAYHQWLNAHRQLTQFIEQQSPYQPLGEQYQQLLCMTLQAMKYHTQIRQQQLALSGPSSPKTQATFN